MGSNLRPYAEPIVKMIKSPIFLDRDRWSLITMGMGRHMMSTSVATPKPAVAWNSAGRSMHLPVVMVKSQPFAIGVQAKRELKKMPTLEPTLTAMTQ